MFLPLLPLLLACEPQLPETASAPPLLLARHPETLIGLELSPGNRPGARPAPERLTLEGPVEECWRDGDRAAFCLPLPFDQVFYGHSNRDAPAGMELLDAEGAPLPYRLDRSARPDDLTWRVRPGQLELRPPEGQPLPPLSQLSLRYPPSAAWENSLDPATSGLEGAEHALREVTLQDVTRHGALLPAPARARWRVEVPRGAVFEAEARVLPPAVDQGFRSDGVTATLRLHTQEATRELVTLAVGPDHWLELRADLAPWAGQRVELELTVDPGAHADLDYLFVAHPTVYCPSRRPRQVVLIFADTLRRDHLGLHGYPRGTSPVIDAWSDRAVVFDDARATSSWTLPSTRALLTGMPQGAWGQTEPLQVRLGRAGFTTGAFVANAFLTHAFGMGTGWEHYEYDLLAGAGEQVDRALAFLEDHAQRDAMVMVQLMDPHMPYREPAAFQGRWSGEEPDWLAGKINRRDLREMRLRDEQRATAREYLVGRYDQNIRYLDHELARLLAHLDEDAVVVFFSDHGEEFFEHDSVEHGHTLYDELLRVPLIIAGPGLPPGRVDTPVSLLDLTPTLLDLLQVDPEARLLGRSLLPLALGDPRALEAFAARPLFFGDLLYGNEAWGVRAPVGLKWISTGGTQKLFDLHSDPNEQANLARQAGAGLERFPPLLAEALDREVQPVWRLSGRGDQRIVRDFPGQVELSHPAGLARVWHPLNLTGDMAEPKLDGDRLTLERSEGRFLPRETFVQPAGDPLDPTGATLVVSAGESRWESTRSEDARPPEASRASRQVLLSAGKREAHFQLSLHWAPVPYDEEQGMEPSDGSIGAHLEALGYVDG
jgi:arylsulfatase A-like enzyme